MTDCDAIFFYMTVLTPEFTWAYSFFEISKNLNRGPVFSFKKSKYKGISYYKMIVSTTSNTDQAYLSLIKTNSTNPEFV